MPDVEYERRLAVLERQVALLTTRTRPNQNLSTGSAVEFLTYLSGTRGTWVPVFAGTTIAGAFTYTTNVGYYVVVSNMVHVFGRILISAIGTPPTGNMRILGLPFAANATYQGGACFTWISNINYTAGALALTAATAASNSYFDLIETFDNAVRVSYPAANFTNVAAELRFFGLYMGA